jgi:hypothetical protein
MTILKVNIPKPVAAGMEISITPVKPTKRSRLTLRSAAKFNFIAVVYEVEETVCK